MWLRIMIRDYKKILSFLSILSFSLAPSFAAGATTTKSVEAKNAVDELRKGSATKKDVIVVYNEDFVKGEELFQLNRPKDAIVYFERALGKENVDPKVYVYLGACYYQIERYDKSFEVCMEGLSKEGSDKKILAYNAGNSCYALGNYGRADASYAVALDEDPDYSPAVLNRANARLKLNRLSDARESYIRYLELEKDSPQRERIEIIIRLLDAEIERRANERPELVNPDVLVAGEKADLPEPLEKVASDLPFERTETYVPAQNELVRDEANAPALPAVVAQKENGERVFDEMSGDGARSPEPEKTISSKSDQSFFGETLGTERIDVPEIASALSPDARKAPAARSSPGISELVRDSDEQARFAEESRLALEAERARLADEARRELEAEKARIEEEARKELEAEKARLAAEEAERRRDEDMRLALEVEKARLAEESRLALEAEKARLAEENMRMMELEKARLAAEEARRALEAEKSRLEEETKRAIEAEKARIAAEEARKELEAEKIRLEEESRKALDAERARIAAEEARRELEAEKARLAEESKKALEAEKKRIAEEEAERKRAEEARLAEEAEKARLEEEAKKEAERKAIEEKRAKEVASWPEPVADISVRGGYNFTPDGDGQNDSVVFGLDLKYLEESPDAWSVLITDPHGNPFREIKGTGDLPKAIEWDGFGDDGEVVLSKNTYTASLIVTPSQKDRARTGLKTVQGRAEIHTGLLLEVIVPGHEWKMVVNSINFVPNGGLTGNLTEEQRKSNEDTLDEIAEQIKDHPGAKVVIVEGYANNVSGTAREDKEELVPLSQMRADAIVDELVKRGVSRELLNALGKGGANPLASQDDRANWWKNRRVEFRIKQ